MIKKLLITLMICNAFSLFSNTDQNAEREEKYTLSICALFTDEAKHLKEWIEYHRLIGVDHFYLYNNNSNDSFLKTLIPYIENNLVTLSYWPDHYKKLYGEEVQHWSLSTQVTAYENAIALRKHETEWLICADVNEFLAIPNQEDLLDILQQYAEYPGILLKSDFFDVSQPSIVPKRKLVIETIERIAAPHKNPYVGVAKMIFRPKLYAGFMWPPYQCFFASEQTPIVLHKSELKVNCYANRFLSSRDSYRFRNKIQINHQVVSENEIDQLLDLGYEIEDEERSLYRFKPQLMKQLGYEDGLGF